MPEHISPMLCTLVQEPPTDSNYLFELKWDGYRIGLLPVIQTVKSGVCIPILTGKLMTKLTVCFN